MDQKIDWLIHLVANGACDECGEVETDFLPYMCNAHTHGLERYGHLDFQMVLFLPTEEIGRILNTLGLRVQSGERFQSGDMVSGIYEDCNVRLDEYEETGRKVLRVIIPDAINIFPGEGDCTLPYCLQLLKTDELCAERGIPS
ncbi:MAG: DUF4262 domain-containing protein [Clostridiales bacterium]|nr:DUF4262 domain-containing protein [Clostridiales bacterium]MDU3239661.1 DUF4262 domain-containing protein [Clostridiales bacterium]